MSGLVESTKNRDRRVSHDQSSNHETAVGVGSPVARNSGTKSIYSTIHRDNSSVSHGETGANAVDEDAVFKALASKTRRLLMDALKDRPQTTGELCQLFPALNRCTVMQHLSVLCEADLVISERRGRERWNYLNPLPIKHLHDRWIGPLAANAVDLLDRLKSDLES